MFSKWLPIEAAILKSLKLKFMKQFISQKNVYTYTSENCNLCLLYRYSFYAVVLEIAFFYKVYMEIINIHIELLTSQPH